MQKPTSVIAMASVLAVLSSTGADAQRQHLSIRQGDFCRPHEACKIRQGGSALACKLQRQKRDRSNLPRMKRQVCAEDRPGSEPSCIP
jgi:hypothetical protein